MATPPRVRTKQGIDEAHCCKYFLPTLCCPNEKQTSALGFVDECTITHIFMLEKKKRFWYTPAPSVWVSQIDIVACGDFVFFVESWEHCCRYCTYYGDIPQQYAALERAWEETPCTSNTSSHSRSWRRGAVTETVENHI